MPLPIVFLPASSPGDTRFGVYPPSCGASTDRVHAVHFPHQVWYAPAQRAATWQQIHHLDIEPCILVGFSKSGLGAMNMALERPQQVRGVLVFDAPLSTTQPHSDWATEAFYPDMAAWQKDQPLPRWCATPTSPPLVLLGGCLFHEQMAQAARVLSAAGRSVLWLPQPDRPHSWDGDWIDQGLAALTSLMSDKQS